MPNSITTALATTIGAASLLGFLLAATVNALTYAGINLPARVPIAGPVHIGAVIAVGAAVLLARSGLAGTSPGVGARLAAWPLWVRAGLLAAGLYALLNVALHYYGADSAVPGLERTRMLSSIWMALYLGAALVLLAAPAPDAG
jgi:hypothetical protein